MRNSALTEGGLALNRWGAAVGLACVFGAPDTRGTHGRSLLEISLLPRTIIDLFASSALCLTGFAAPEQVPLPYPKPHQPDQELQLPGATPCVSHARSEPRIAEAKLLFEMGKLVEATAKLQQVIRDCPTNEAAYHYLILVAEAEANQRDTWDQLPTPQVEIERTGMSPDGPHVRLFRVNPVAFREKWPDPSSRSTGYMVVGMGMAERTNGADTISAEQSRARLRSFFDSAGVGPPKAVLFNERHGLLAVHAKRADLEKIEQTLRSANSVAR